MVSDLSDYENTSNKMGQNAKPPLPPPRKPQLPPRKPPIPPCKLQQKAAYGVADNTKMTNSCDSEIQQNVTYEVMKKVEVPSYQQNVACGEVESGKGPLDHAMQQSIAHGVIASAKVCKQESVASGGVLPDVKMLPNVTYDVPKCKSLKSKNAKTISDHEIQQNYAYGISMVPLENKMQQNIAYEAVKITKGKKK